MLGKVQPEAGGAFAPLFLAGDGLTGSRTSSTTRRPDPARPAPLDGPLPDVLADLDAQFVVEWQVVDIWQPRGRGAEIPAV
jgi:hypothetical protein